MEVPIGKHRSIWAPCFQKLEEQLTFQTMAPRVTQLSGDEEECFRSSSIRTHTTHWYWQPRILLYEWDGSTNWQTQHVPSGHCMESSLSLYQWYEPPHCFWVPLAFWRESMSDRPRQGYNLITLFALLPFTSCMPGSNYASLMSKRTNHKSWSILFLQKPTGMV
jgi:hypothetical protein